MEVKVSALFRVREDVASYAPTHVVSVLDPRIEKHRIPSFPGVENVLQTFFYDDDDLVYQEEPIDIYVKKILSFFSEFLSCERGDRRLLVHCHAGASRSPALAYALLAMKRGRGSEHDAFAELLTLTVKPWPSRNLVAIADGILERAGALLDPLDAYRAAHPRRYDAYVRLNRRREI